MPVRQSYNRNLIQFIFWIKVFFYVNVFKVDFVLNIGVYLCLFAFSWIEIKHKTRCCHRENSFVLTNKMYKQKLRKRKTVNVQIKKIQSTLEIYGCRRKIMIRIKRTHSHTTYSFLNQWKTTKPMTLAFSDIQLVFINCFVKHPV